MIYTAGAILVLALMFGPFLWVRYVMARYGDERDDIPGTGAELARHLLDRFDMQDYKVEVTNQGGDHFDPGSATVRLGPSNHDRRSLTAVAVAAHEVGHALQFHRQEKVAELWARHVPRANRIRKVGIGILMLIPLVVGLLHAPHAILLNALAGVGVMLISVFSYAFILPMEWDASFYKALPVLEQGDYVRKDQLPAIRRILLAAALTYLAVALLDIIRLWRWGRVLRPL